ncbi:MAG: crotonase/enoyl-CoA hydratase family protein [Myxococcota bacterium]
MELECFRVDVSDKVANVVMCRPDKRNSMIPAFWRELPELITRLDESSEARVVVISSEGPHFSSGMDISVFTEIAQPEHAHQKPAAFMGMVRTLQRTFNALEQCRVPVIAAMQGGVIGGAVDMVTACDIRYATRDSFVCIEETNIAMTADVGTFPRLVKLIPEGVCRELAYTGRRMPAEEAKAVGLVNEIFDDQATMLARVNEIARTIASKAPLAVHGCKRMITHARDHSTADTLDYIAVWNASMFIPEQVQEAFMAKMQKREAEFVDLPPRDGVFDKPAGG